MTPHPDKLFRDKLENFQRTAPPAAWNRIEQNLGKRKTPLVWVRIAAGITLLATAAIILWPSQKDDTVLSNTNNLLQPKTEVTQPVVTDSAKQQAPTLKKAAENYTALREPKPNPKKQQTVSPVQTPENEQPVIIPLQPANDQLIAEATMPVQQHTVEPQKNDIVIASNTITYTAEEMNSKFLKKKPVPEATPEAEDASTMQKLIGYAYAAKNSDADIGNLRQKKDEILALNFRSKKSGN